MKVAVCYICVTQSPDAENYASRFAATYRQHQAGYEHDLLIAFNGGLPSPNQHVLRMLRLFFPYSWPRENHPGWDIATFIEAAKGPCAEYRLLVCLGESAHFHRAGWLKRLVEAAEKHGPGMYGILSSNAVRPHLNTSAFAVTPGWLAQWPVPLDKKQRYNFEHGAKPFWRFVENQSRAVRLVTWDGEWKPRDWRKPENIMWRGDQSNCLVWTKHTERWFHAEPQTRQRWSRNADQKYQ